MVTAYYIMKMSRKNNKVNNYQEYYNNLDTEMSTLTFNFNISDKACRVCLKNGSLPIYDYEDTHIIKEAILIFCGIMISKDDLYFPKYLCKVCYKFLKDAMLFRKIAKQTNEAMKNGVEKGTLPCFRDIDEYEQIQKACIQELKGETLNGTENQEQSNIATNKTKSNAKVKCQICGSIIKESYYNEHVTMHDPNHPRYKCEICNKTFRLRCAYHTHKWVHRDDFPFQCKLCPYKGKYADLLRNHMKTHSGEKKYMCTECPARFLFIGNLHSHVRTRHRQPQFKCDLCDKLFKLKFKLKQHVERDHIGTKNHVCSTCGKAFSIRRGLVNHQRNVHKREKFQFSRMPAYLKEKLNEKGDDVEKK